MSEENQEQKACENKGKCKKCRLVSSVILALVVVVIVVLLGVWMFLGTVIRTGVQQVGSAVTKCDIKVEDVSVSLLRGKVSIRNLVVGNPEGFKTANAFTLGSVDVSMKPLSVLSDRIIIDEILVEAPELTYELALSKLTSNLGQMQKNVEEFLASDSAPEQKTEEKKDEKAPEKEKPGKKVQINHVRVSGGKIRLSATPAQGVALPIPLPTIDLNDIGKEKEVSGLEATATVLKETLSSAVSVGSEGAKSLGGGVKEVLKSGGEGVAGVVKGVKEFVKDVKDTVKGIKDDVKEEKK